MASLLTLLSIFLTGLLVGVFGLLAGAYWLFVYDVPNKTTALVEKERQVQKSTRPSPSDGWDPHLNKQGWIQLSNSPLPPHLVGSSTISVQNISTSKLQSSSIISQEIIDNSKSWMDSAVLTSRKVASFLLSRFLGDENAKPDDLRLEIRKQNSYGSKGSNQIAPPFNHVWGVLKHKSFVFYVNDSQASVFRVLNLKDYSVRLYPRNVPDMELFSRYNPIQLIPKKRCQTNADQATVEDTNLNDAELASFKDSAAEPLYLYFPTGYEKEDWWIILKRISRLPHYFADSEALSALHQELGPMRAYTAAMEKLIQNTQDVESPTAWLNALVGRLFVAIHTNQHVKDWLTARLSKHPSSTTSSTMPNESILGDIVVQNVNVGNSLPLLSNPKLLSISVDGEMAVEVDIEYSGGLSIEASTQAQISVPAWDKFMRPLTVPIVVAITMAKFSARLLLKIKPYWESNRIWFGFYRSEPELVLELRVEPIISNKLITLQLVNQVIERRIKEALVEHIMIPHMDDVSFWSWDDILGKNRENSVYSNNIPGEYGINNAYASLSSSDDSSVSFDEEGEETDQSQGYDDDLLGTGRSEDEELKSSLAAAALMGEAIETSLTRGDSFYAPFKRKPKHSNVLLLPAPAGKRKNLKTLHRRSTSGQSGSGPESRRSTSSQSVIRHEEICYPREPSHLDYNNVYNSASYLEAVRKPLPKSPRISQISPLKQVGDDNLHIDRADSSLSTRSDATEQHSAIRNSTPDEDTVSLDEEGDSKKPSNLLTTPAEILGSEQSLMVMESLGNAAYNLGTLTRKYGIDHKAKNTLENVKKTLQPAVDYASETTKTYTQKVQDVAANIGISAIARLGLQKHPSDDEDSESRAEDTVSVASSMDTNGGVRQKPSTWSVLGLQVQTAPPRILVEDTSNSGSSAPAAANATSSNLVKGARKRKSKQNLKDIGQSAEYDVQD